MPNWVFKWKPQFLAILCLALASQVRAQPENIPVPNQSFESPKILFVDLNLQSWQKTPKPDGYQETADFLWSQLSGVFKNTAVGSSDHIVNIDGTQAVWIFAVPEAGIFQDATSVDSDDLQPSHDFDVRFAAGKSYTLTVGAIGNGGAMKNGVTAQLSLYYRDAAGRQVSIASTTLTNSSELFPDRNHLVDFSVEVPSVKPSDPWANQSIGIGLLSTVTDELKGGYWVFDNFRLQATGDLPLELVAKPTNATLEIFWQSSPKRRYQLQVSADFQSWKDVESPIQGTGERLSKSVSSNQSPQAFVRLVVTTAP